MYQKCIIRESEIMARMLTDKEYQAKKKRLRKMYDAGKITLMEYFLQLGDYYRK